MSENMETRKTLDQKLKEIPGKIIEWGKKKANVLFGVGESTNLIIARSGRTVAILIAIVLTAFGCVEIVDVKHMKAVLDVTKLVMGDVLVFLIRKYLIWALLILAAGIACFYTMRYLDRKAKAAV